MKNWVAEGIASDVNDFMYVCISLDNNFEPARAIIPFMNFFENPLILFFLLFRQITEHTTL